MIAGGKKENRLQQILGRTKRTPEDIKREEEEYKRQEKERIRREGEVKALFEEYIIYGKKCYAARVHQLLKYLKSDINAIKFWKDRHIRKKYNIVNEVNFLFSIYTEDDNDKKHDTWLRRHLSNPFVSTGIVDCGTINYMENVEDIFRFEDIYDSERNLRERFDGIEEINDLEHSNIIKAREYKDLLDKEYFSDYIISPSDKIYFVNPLLVTDNNFLRLDTYDIWRGALGNEWGYVEISAPIMIKLLDELVRTRKIYLKEIEKK